jgi:hypothetical protein
MREAIIQSDIKDFEVKYVFIKSFEWNSAEDRVRFNGHPHQSEVYRMIHHNQSKTDSIIISVNNQVDALTFDKLVDKEPDKVYTSEILEITLENILDFDLSTKELDKLLEWMDSKNEDLLRKLNPNHNQNLLPQPIITALAESMIDKFQEDTEDMNHAQMVMGDLLSLNSHQFYIILEIVQALIDYNLGDEDPSKFLLMGDKGLAINMADAMRSLAQYSSGPKMGEEREQLLGAVLAIATELERRDLLNLD